MGLFYGTTRLGSGIRASFSIINKYVGGVATVIDGCRQQVRQ